VYAYKKMSVDHIGFDFIVALWYWMGEKTFPQDVLLHEHFKLDSPESAHRP